MGEPERIGDILSRVMESIEEKSVRKSMRWEKRPGFDVTFPVFDHKTSEELAAIHE